MVNLIPVLYIMISYFCNMSLVSSVLLLILNAAICMKIYETSHVSSAVSSGADNGNKDGKDSTEVRGGLPAFIILCKE